MTRSLRSTATRYRAGVHLEPLSVFRWSHDEVGRGGVDNFALVRPYGSEEGIGYGEGRGTATGRIEGTVVWSNHPRPGINVYAGIHEMRAKHRRPIRNPRD